MVTVSRRTLLPLMEPILAPTLCSVRAPNPIRASGAQFFSADHHAYRRRSYLKLQ